MIQKYAVGVIELSSIARGFEVQDAVLKSASVRKLLARTICSGKYLVMVSGELADVEAALETARSTGGATVINTENISNVDERVLTGLGGGVPFESAGRGGLAVIETFSAASAIRAADVAVKAADVEILRIHVAMAVGGKGITILAGDIESLRSAVGAALEFLKTDGLLVGSTLITSPHPDVFRELL
jgi:microcompartment protein CcmL/EutN